MLRASPSGQSDCGLIIAILRSQIYKLSGILLASQEEQRMTQEVHAPSGLHAVLTGPLGRFAKGGNALRLFAWRSFSSHYSCMPALEEEAYVMHHLCFRSLLMPGPQADPSDRHGTNHRTRDSVAAYWLMPLPQHILHWALPKGEFRFLPVRTKRPQPRPRGSAFSKTTVWEPESYW